ncbi:MAG: aminotransferase class I/II-fold pyridoxal phosphate-dependent enzyme, partial [Planctomycetota bacterium]
MSVSGMRSEASASEPPAVRYDLSRRGLPARDPEALLAWLEPEEQPPLEQVPLLPAPPGGSAALRAAIAAQCDSGIDAGQIVVTTGRAAAVALLAAALEPAGRTVVLDAPIDRRMPALWSARGGAVLAVPRRLENGWRFEIERFEHALQAPS